MSERNDGGDHAGRNGGAGGEFRRRYDRMRVPKKRRLKVLLSDLVAKRAALQSVLDMGALAPDDPRAVNFDREARTFLPTISDAALLGLSLPVQFEAVMMMRARADQMLDYAQGLVTLRALQKMEDHTTPGDTRLIVEFMKGRGLFQPSKRVSDEQRQRRVARAQALEGKTMEELEQMAHSLAQGIEE